MARVSRQFECISGEALDVMMMNSGIWLKYFVAWCSGKDGCFASGTLQHMILSCHNILYATDTKLAVNWKGS